MANADNAKGLIPFEVGAENAIVREYTVASSAIVYPGDPVILSSGKVTPSATAATDDIFGVALGYVSQGAVTTTFGKSGDKIPVIINPEDVVFRIQSDGATAESDIGKYYQLTVTTGNTTTKRSTVELDDSSGAAQIGTDAGGDLGLRWRLVGKVESEGETNDWGSANVDVLVRFQKGAGEDTA